MVDRWPPLALRQSRSQHELLDQDARIQRLLSEMNPAMSNGTVPRYVFPGDNGNYLPSSSADPLRILIDDAPYAVPTTSGGFPTAKYGTPPSNGYSRRVAPPYELLYPPAPTPSRTPAGGETTANSLNGKMLPPTYNQVIASRNRMQTSKPTWSMAPTRLSRSPTSPSGRFLSYDDHQRVNCGNSEEFSCSTQSRDSESPSPPEDSSRRIARNTVRQASFIAAVQRQPLGENRDTSNAVTPSLRLSSVETSTAVNEPSELDRDPPLRRRSRRSGRDVNLKGITNGRGTARAKTESLLLQHHRRTTVYGDQLISSSTYRESRSDANLLDQNQNDSCITMRRTRPKSYVLATSSSPTGGAESTVSAVSQDDTSRELSSMGSMSSIDNSARSAGARLEAAYGSGPESKPSSSHSLQKIMSIFHKDSKNRFRPKRSRTSLPVGRIPIPTIKENDVFRQGWVKHQEIPVGKTIRRSDWCDYWAILLVNQQQLILCGQQPIVSLQNGEKILTTPPSLRVDVSHSVVDIAYDFLKDGRHVLRMLTQGRTEHVMQLSSESDMLAWISSLQSIADTPTSGHLQTSCSAASLASSTSLGHPGEERNVLTNSASANQLIMHRYKAKSSQLHSPVTSKRAAGSAPGTSGIQNDHFSQPGTSKDGSSVENGEPSTPKSGRKWKKSKANKQGSGGSSSSSLPPQQSILGVKLSDCTMSPEAEENVPLVVQICVTVVEANGMDTVGIYRIPGNTAAVNALRDTLSQSIEAFTLDSIDPSDSRWRDVNVVSSLLKMFLRKLPEPVLTDKLYPFFIDGNRIANHTQRLHKLRNLLRKLPRHHYCTLRYLIRHLAEVTRKSDVNKMETRNLALMFGPSIVRPSDDNMATMVTHMSDQCKIIETLIHYNKWMFNEDSPADDEVPEQHPSENTGVAIEPAQYGVGMPSTVSASTFNDMHNLIRKANEDQATALMNEGKGGKIKNILRRNSRRDKSKSKLKIESTAPAATHPRVTDISNHNHATSPSGAVPRPQSMSTSSQITRTPTQQSSVDSAFQGNYQERDIDAEILSRQTISPLASTVEQSPSLESSLGSIPDTSRTDPGVTTSSGFEAAEERKRRQQDMYSARRIFISGCANAAEDNRAVDALASHTHHLNMANSPALEVLSEETREKIRKMQRKQNWIEKPKDVQLRSLDQLKMTSPVKDLSDAVSCTSDYSTTSSAPISQPLAVVCMDPPTSSDYASSFSDPSPCARNASASPRQRPSVLPVNSAIIRQLQNETVVVNPEVGSIGERPRCQQKIRLRSKTSVGGLRDPSRRHTLSDMDSLKEGRLDKLARWFGIRKSSPDVSKEEQEEIIQDIEDRENIMTESAQLSKQRSIVHEPPAIIKTSPAELTPASGDEQL